MGVRTCKHATRLEALNCEHCPDIPDMHGVEGTQPALDARILALLRRIYWTGEWQTAELEAVLRELEKR